MPCPTCSCPLFALQQVFCEVPAGNYLDVLQQHRGDVQGSQHCCLAESVPKGNVIQQFRAQGDAELRIEQHKLHEPYSGVSQPPDPGNYKCQMLFGTVGP